MFSEYQEDYEDEVYQDEADSSLSDADSELQFRLYSQLHYVAENQDAHEEVREQESSIPQAQPQQKSLPPSAAPVDVIVIDSGPDAITLSDNTEEDDSVYAKKGQTSMVFKKGTPHNTHLPAPSHSQTISVSPDDIVVLDESSDSDSKPPFVADLGSDSDSDGVENWMILGREKCDQDLDIQINCSLPKERGKTVVLCVSNVSSLYNFVL